MKKDEYINKLTEYERLLKKNKNDGTLWLEYASFLDSESYNYKKLLNALKMAQVLLPEKDLRFQIGDAYVKAGEIEKGLSKIKEVLNEEKSAVGFCYLADSYYYLEKYEDAIKACQKAINIDPNYEEAYYLYAESIRYKSKKKSIEYYYKAIHLDPEFQEAWSSLGRELISMNDRVEEGLVCLDKAIELNPDDGWAILYRANGLWKIGELSKAEEAYKAAIKVFQDYSDVYKWYAEFLKSQNRINEANIQMNIYKKRLRA